MLFTYIIPHSKMGSEDARCIPCVQVMTGVIMMDKETVVFFLDYANINRTARERRYRLDYRDLLAYVGEGRFLVDARCYVPINPRSEHRLGGAVDELWRAGYIVMTSMGTIAGGTYKCNFDVEIAMDVLKVVHQVKPDI